MLSFSTLKLVIFLTDIRQIFDKYLSKRFDKYELRFCHLELDQHPLSACHNQLQLSNVRLQLGNSYLMKR